MAEQEADKGDSGSFLQRETRCYPMEQTLPQFVPKLMATTAFLATAISLTWQIAEADYFKPQILPQSGGTIAISILPNQGWHDGSITFPASNVPTGTAVYARGFVEPVPLLGTPVASQTGIYSIIISFDPKFTTSFATSAATTVQLTLPQRFNLSEPLSMYETDFEYQTPPSPATWNGPFRGTVTGNMVTFPLPVHAFRGTTIVVLAVMQESAHDTSRKLQSTNDSNSVALTDSQPHVDLTNFKAGAVKLPPQPVLTQPPLSLVRRVCFAPI